MPKRPSDEHGGGRSAKLSTRRRRRHFYLVLDDWELGYSIRKIDLPPDSGSDDLEQSTDDDCTTEQCLPPAVFRLEAPHVCSGLFAAFSSKIMFMAVHDTPWGTIPMYDVHMRALTAAPRRESEPSPYGCAYVQVDSKLFLLDDSHFEMLQPPPPPVDGARFKVKFDWSWYNLPEPRYQTVVSHAVHPDGRTMVFSMLKRTLKRLKLATFSFNIDSSCWTRHGAWGLPFKGCGYFDRDLDAWVGLSCDPETLGYLCACDVLSANTRNRQPPTCKLSKEKLFGVDPTEEHIGATLVYLGERSSFCLVQCLSTDDRQGGIWKESLPECRRYLLRVTTFSLKYDKNGDLRTAKHRQIGSYRLPEIARVYWDHLERPVAFWI